MIAWYLDEIENDIESEADLIEQKQVIEKVVDKLIYQDQVFLLTFLFHWTLSLCMLDKRFKLKTYSGYCAVGKHCKGIARRRPLPSCPSQLLLLRCLICILSILRILSLWHLHECPFYCCWDVSNLFTPKVPQVPSIYHLHFYNRKRIITSIHCILPVPVFQ